MDHNNVLRGANQFKTIVPQKAATTKRRNKKSNKGETKIFRAARKIKNLGINRQIVPDLPNCSFNCQNKTSQEDRQEVWDEFRAIIDMNLRLQYLANLIEITAPIRIRVPKSSNSKSRSCVNKYYLKFNEYLDNSDFQLCKVCFMTVFNVTASKIRTVVEKKLKDGEDIQYKRGKKLLPTTIEYLGEPECILDETGCMTIKMELGYETPTVMSNNISGTIEAVIENSKIKRKRPSKKGQTGEYRTARKIKNLGVDRELVPNLPNCSLDCRAKTSHEVQQAVWNEFRKIVDMNIRIKYLANLIQFKPASHVKVKEDRRKKRRCIPIFHLKWVKNARNAHNRLCKVCFMTVFNLTKSKVTTIVKKKCKNLELEYNRGKKKTEVT